MRIIVGVTGASGVEMSCALAETLKSFPDCAVHLVVSDAARRNWELETAMPFEQFVSMADVVHDVHNMAASISSGSFVTDGMIIAPRNAAGAGASHEPLPRLGARLRHRAADADLL